MPAPFDAAALAWLGSMHSYSQLQYTSSNSRGSKYNKTHSTQMSLLKCQNMLLGSLGLALIQHPSELSNPTLLHFHCQNNSTQLLESSFQNQTSALWALDHLRAVRQSQACCHHVATAQHSWEQTADIILEAFQKRKEEGEEEVNSKKYPVNCFVKVSFKEIF